MKIVSKFLFYFILLIFLNSCNGTGARVIFKNAPDVTDYRIFENDSLVASPKPYHFSKQESNIDIPDFNQWILAKNDFKANNFEEFLDESKTTAFLVIKDDTIVYESYHNGYDADSFLQVFSVTKAFTATLAGIAIEEGKIKSIEQPVSDFIPEFAEDERKDIRIKDLLQMTSGLKFSDHEQVLRLGRMYYNKEALHFMQKTKMKYKPSTHFAYSSMSSLILGICVERACGQSYTSYLQEKLWTPLGMEHNGLVNVSKRDRVAQAFGGLSTIALDLAKFGRLYLNDGNWEGQQIISKEWADAAGKRDTTEGSFWGYNRGFWLHTYDYRGEYYKDEHDSPVPAPEVMDMTDFTAIGYRGEIVYVNPDYNMIVVRLGTSESGIVWNKSLLKLCDLLNE